MVWRGGFEPRFRRGRGRGMWAPPAPTRTETPRAAGMAFPPAARRCPRPPGSPRARPSWPRLASPPALDVPDPDRLQDSPHGLPRDDAGPGRGRAQQDESPAITSLDFMGDGLFFQGDGDHLALGHFASLANRIGNLSSFAETDANTPLFVP